VLCDTSGSRGSGARVGDAPQRSCTGGTATVGVGGGRAAAAAAAVATAAAAAAAAAATGLRGCRSFIGDETDLACPIPIHPAATASPPTLYMFMSSAGSRALLARPAGSGGDEWPGSWAARGGAAAGLHHL
jgi:hypothetical protein